MAGKIDVDALRDRGTAATRYDPDSSMSSVRPGLVDSDQVPAPVPHVEPAVDAVGSGPRPLAFVEPSTTLQPPRPNRATPPTLLRLALDRVTRPVIGRPEMLVADEPTGNVDPDMAERLLHLFDSLNRLGTTVVVATHDFHLLNRIPNARMMRIEKGRLNDPTGALRHPPGGQ